VFWRDTHGLALPRPRFAVAVVLLGAAAVFLDAAVVVVAGASTVSLFASGAAARLRCTSLAVSIGRLFIGKEM